MSRRASPTSKPLTGAEPTPAAAVRRSRGQPLDAAMRATMEARFAHDFSQVRVFADDAAADAARAARAQAWTAGSDIVFGAGRYAPGTAGGDALIAHELAHVVQQARGAGAGRAANAEQRADAAAADALRGRTVSPQSLGGAPHGMQAKPDDAPLASPLIATPQALASVEIDAGETISKTHPKLVQVADSYRSAGGGVRVRLSADLPSDAKNNSERERTERGRLGARMRDARDALRALGVPSDAIDIWPATAYSTAAHGQIAATVRRPAAVPLLVPPLLPSPQGVLPSPNIPPAPASGLPSLDLDFSFGPVTVSLPKEVRAKLPIPLAGAKKLVIDLGFEVPAKFSFKITLDGTQHVKVSLKAGAELDPKNTSVTGSAGLQIETTSTICRATDPGETREKIKSAGDKLNKAAKELEAATGTDKLGKAFDIAGAIGEMYDAVEKAKAKCKQVPRATIEFGYKRVLTPGEETDRSKLPADYLGITGTFRF